MNEVKFAPNQVVIITETHITASGKPLLKDRIGLVFGGETFGVLDEKEIPVVFASSDAFIGVNIDKLDHFKGDVEKIYQKAAIFDEIEEEFVTQEQIYKNNGLTELADAFRLMRQELFVKLVCSTYKWSEAEAVETFLRQEQERVENFIKPYAIEPTNTTIN